MKFLRYIRQLKESYDGSIRYTDSGDCLLGPEEKRPLVAVHTIFAPMPEKMIQYLCDSYKRRIPEELLEIYREANGMGLFMDYILIEKINFRLPCRQLSIYGVPRTNDRTGLEPFNISLEDLSRLPGTPDSWLKFGSFQMLHDPEFGEEYQLFVDVETNCTYLCPCAGETVCIRKQWNSVDACLCELFERLQKA